MQRQLAQSLGLVCLAVFGGLPACGGGGGGGGGPGNQQVPPSGNHGAFLPSVPPTLGVAGVMDGDYEVVAIEVLADARNRAASEDRAPHGIGEVLTFRNGVLDEEDESSGPAEPGGATIPGTLDFYANELRGTVTVYCLGVTIGDNPWIGPGSVRIGMIVGTTAPDLAEAYALEEDLLPRAPFGAVDHFGSYRLRLQRVTDGAPAARLEAIAPHERQARRIAARQR